jgi:hypothetical protein
MKRNCDRNALEKTTSSSKTVNEELTTRANKKIRKNDVNVHDDDDGANIHTVKEKSIVIGKIDRCKNRDQNERTFPSNIILRVEKSIQAGGLVFEMSRTQELSA